MFSIEEWNGIFGFKILDADLRKPTETFVFNALISYLKMFNFDVSTMVLRKNSENAEDRMRLKIEFCNYIDHLYKISDKSNSFLYYDLIHPAPKKTAHMLNHLLNYYLFYSHFKTEVMSVVDENICERNKMKDRVNQMKIQNEEIKIKAKSIDAEIKEHKRILPEITEKLDNLIVREKTQLEEKQKIEETIKGYQNRSDMLEEELIQLKNEVVSDNEVDRLLESKAKFKALLAEQEEIERDSLASNQVRSQQISKMQLEFKQIQSTMEQYPITSLVSFKSNEIKYSEQTTKLGQLNAIKLKMEENLKKSENEVLEYIELAQKQEITLQQLQIDYENQHVQLNSVLDAEIKRNESIEMKLRAMEDDLSAENEHSDFIMESARELVKHCKEVL